MHVTKSKFARGGSSHNINLLTPTGRRAVDIRLVKIIYLCIHCLGKLKSKGSGVQCELNDNHYGYIHRDEANQLTQEERFMKIGKMFPSDYVRGIDIERPIIVTIKAVTAERVRNNETGKMEDEFVMRFIELDKKLRLNLTMAKACALAVGDEDMDTDNWVGKRITIYRDKVKSFGKEHIVPRLRGIQSDDVDLAKAIKTAQPAKNGKQEGPAFADLLTKLSDDFGLDEPTAKGMLKDLGYTGYKASQFQQMYDSVEAVVSREEETLGEGQAALFEEETLENGPGAAYDETGY